MSANATPLRRVFSAIDGVLLLDKAVGITSNRALQQVRHLFGAAKAGHTGTLDPLCSGLLPVCFGEATKFSGFHLAADKLYRATLRLGVTTTTGDSEGEVVTQRPVSATAAQIETALLACRGPQLQIPPMYSALKRAGKPLYEYARSGIEVERAARAIEIFALTQTERSGDLLSVEVHCSKGTYIRVLAEKIGELLGCGAHLAGLRRNASGDFAVAGALTFERLAAMDETARQASLQPVDSLLRSLQSVVLDADQARRFRLGQAIDWPAQQGQTVRVYDGAGALLGVAAGAPGMLAPKRLLANATNSI